jgi:hypothetical protein
MMTPEREKELRTQDGSYEPPGQLTEALDAMAYERERADRAEKQLQSWLADVAANRTVKLDAAQCHHAVGAFICRYCSGHEELAARLARQEQWQSRAAKAEARLDEVARHALHVQVDLYLARGNAARLRETLRDIAENGVTGGGSFCSTLAAQSSEANVAERRASDDPGLRKSGVAGNRNEVTPSPGTGSEESGTPRGERCPECGLTVFHDETGCENRHMPIVSSRPPLCRHGVFVEWECHACAEWKAGAEAFV